MKRSRIVSVIGLAMLIGVTAYALTPPYPQLTAYEQIKVGENATTTAATLKTITNGSKTAVTKTPGTTTAPEVWDWVTTSSTPQNPNAAPSSTVTTTETKLSVAFKNGKVVALMYSSTARTETPTEKSLIQDVRVKGEKTFLTQLGI